MGMTRAFRRAVRTAFGALGLAFLFGGPAIAVTRGGGLFVPVFLAVIGVVSLLIAALMLRGEETRQ